MRPPKRFRALVRSAKPRVKSRRVEIDGVWWDSRQEWRRWAVLFPLFKAGRIVDLRRQVSFPLTAVDRATGERLKVCTYRADFTYGLDGRLVVEDVKGWRTEMYKLKKKWLKAEYGIDVQEV